MCWNEVWLAMREPDLLAAELDGPTREVRLLADHREDLVTERTRATNRLRWHPHELNPSLDPPVRSLWRLKHLTAVPDRLAKEKGTVARLARARVKRCRTLSIETLALDKELELLLTIRGAAPSTGPRSSAKRPAVSGDSAPAMPPSGTTAPRRYLSGPETENVTAWPARGTARSTPPCTASRSPIRAWASAAPGPAGPGFHRAIFASAKAVSRSAASPGTYSRSATPNAWTRARQAAAVTATAPA